MKRISLSTGLFPASFDSHLPAAGKRWRLHLMRLVNALGAGAGTVPFGDNGDVFRALAESHARSERSAQATCPPPGQTRT